MASTHDTHDTRKQALVHRNYVKNADDEVGLFKGEYVSNIKVQNATWWMGTNSLGERGLFPHAHVDIVEVDLNHDGINQATVDELLARLSAALGPVAKGLDGVKGTLTVMEDLLRDKIDNTGDMISSDADCLTPRTEYTFTTPKAELIVNDPATPEGQRSGAVLMIKWNTGCDRHVQVGDYVEVLRFQGSERVDIKNLRTGNEGNIKWLAVFPAPYEAGECDCGSGSCRCIYETHEQSLERRPTKNANHREHPTICDPGSPEGQKIGAVLRVEQKPWTLSFIRGKLGIEVGDLVQILDFSVDDSNLLQGKNLRTGFSGSLSWNAFKTVNTRQICECRKQACYCKYDNLAESQAYRKKIDG